MPESSTPSPTLPADLADLIARCRALPLPHLVEALRADQARRWRSGRPLPAEAYLGAFPALAASPEDALVLVWGEALLRLEAGEAPRPDEYRARFPQHADTLTLQFELQGHLEPSAGALTLALGEPPDEVGPRLPAVPGYEIQGELGRGGMGVVYKARQASLNRVVALKMLLAGAYAGPEQRDRFRAEAEAVARLRHPNIVQIFEVGEHAGRPYLVLEYVEGGALDERLHGAPQNPRAAAAMAETLARAVHAAHQQGVVHRDLKPANVLLALSRETQASPSETLAGVSRLNEAVPKITDFGLAKQLDADRGRTPSEAVLGTPSYMAPEQASGKMRSVGTAADVYALGAILYEMLTGRPPFRGETPLDTLQQVAIDDPLPPRALQPKVPTDLETVCLKCLQKDPGRRYASAGELAEDLRRFLAGEPIRARPVGVTGRVSRWCRRKPMVAGLLATLAVVLVAATTGLIGLWLRADRQRRQAEDNLRDARENFQLSLDAVDQLGTDISEDPRLQEHDLRPLRKQLLQKAARFHEVFVSKRSDDPEIQAQQARASFLLGQLTAQIDSKRRAIDYFRQAQGILERLRERQPDVPAHTYHLARCLRQLGGLYADTGQKTEARAAFDKARELAEGLATTHVDVPDYQQEWAAAHTALGQFHHVFGPVTEAEAPLLRAIEILNDLSQRHPDVAAYRQDLARGQALRGSLFDIHMMELRRWRDAGPAYDKALKAQAKLVEQYPKVPDYRADQARYHYLLAKWYRKANQSPEAVGHYRDALRVLEPLVSEHRSVTSYAQLLGGVNFELGLLYLVDHAWEEAKGAFQKALTVREALTARDPSDVNLATGVGNAQSRLSDVALNLGDPSGALEWSAKAITTCNDAKERSPDHRIVRDGLTSAHIAHANALTRLGRHAEALKDWDRVLALHKGPDRPWYCLQRGLTLARLGDHERAVREVEEVMGKGNSYSVMVIRRLSRDAASVYAVAATAALQDLKRPESDRAALAYRYIAAGVASLRRAVENGYADLANLDQDKDLEPLRPRDDFKALLAELAQKSKKQSP